jgi:hypothetical protein
MFHLTNYGITLVLWLTIGGLLWLALVVSGVFS